MANLSVVCSHTVNGVSRMHSELLKTRVFKVEVFLIVLSRHLYCIKKLYSTVDGVLEDLME